MSHFTDRRVLITGASSGIGQALAEAFVKAGAAVVLVARRAEQLQQVCDALRPRGTAIPVVGDVTDPVVRERALQVARVQLGGLDILVNNAGVGAWGNFAIASPERLRTLFEVNFFAACELTRAAVPLLRQGVHPAVVNIGSILGHRAIPRSSEYCASKFALRGWNDALRMELHSEGIHVLLVSPATTATEFTLHQLERRGEMPWRPTGTPPAHVANATLRGLARRRREIFPSAASRTIYWMNRFAPWAVEAYLSRFG